MEKFQFSVVDTVGLLGQDTLTKECKRQLSVLHKVQAGEQKYSDNLGWSTVDSWANEKQIDDLLALSKQIKEKADTLVVIGIGGSNQGARAAISALNKKSSVEIIWAGNNLSSYEANKTLEHLKDKVFVIDVIAKNFETLEPGVAFRIFRHELELRYKKNAKDYIVITGTRGSFSQQLAQQHGYRFLTFPTDIGGRYSVLSDVGLFPMAVADIDIKQLVAGARTMQDKLAKNDTPTNPALEYAVFRNLIGKLGYKIEMLSFFEPRLTDFGRWWVQLMAESEGKDNKGLFPVVSCYSELLHSTGQFVQEGSNILFETFIRVVDDGSPVISLHNDNVDDHFDYLDTKNLSQVNHAAFKATLTAHAMRFPCLELTVGRLEEFELGELFFFFMYTCYLSCLLTGVNPFDQPGVEAYKNYMFQELGKNSAK
ncbi:MAG: glucose-6-phosphate isomerase [Spirochaetia bacterium]|jgi:glucose-6-phosphate isomerase|nr:glucose-6-phosphate isomerase [Spirochaetia bacterium]